MDHYENDYGAVWKQYDLRNCRKRHGGNTDCIFAGNQQLREEKMQELFEEYGTFVIEAVSGMLLLFLLGYVFLGSPMGTLIQRFLVSTLGGCI
jgi:hypothetical protein